MKKFQMAVFVCLLGMAACASPATPGNQSDDSGVATIVAGTLQASAPNIPFSDVTPPTLPPEGVNFGTPPLSGNLPYGLGTAVVDEVTVQVELPYINPSFGDMPAHHQYTIQNYQYAGGIHSPRILVFNAAEFAGYTELTGQIIADLQTHKGELEPLPESLSVSNFIARSEVITFQNGYGIGYLAQIDDAMLPINNADLFYYFQGLSNGGQFYVSAILPVSAPFLAADGNPETSFPAEAVPFEWEGSGDLSQYFASVAKQLEAAASETFHPNLIVLEGLFQSLLLTTP
jgi:hypothetical protein